MSRPVKQFPKRNVVSFRLSDPDFETLKYFAQQVAKPGEKLNETIGRHLRRFIQFYAEKQYVERREALQKSEYHVSITQEEIDARRRQYVAEFRKSADLVREKAEEAAPSRASMGELAFSPSVVVARPEAETHDDETAGTVRPQK